MEIGSRGLLRRDRHTPRQGCAPTHPSIVERTLRRHPHSAQTCTASAIEERRVTTSYEWGQVFGDAVAATAILDRLLHHSRVITIRGDSYR